MQFNIDGLVIHVDRVEGATDDQIEAEVRRSLDRIAVGDFEEIVLD